jgi:hypothetical protein
MTVSAASGATMLTGALPATAQEKTMNKTFTIFGSERIRNTTRNPHGGK